MAEEQKKVETDEHNTGFDTFIILMLFFINVIASGFIIFSFTFFNSTIIQYFALTGISIFCGWITLSVVKKFKFTTRKTIINNIISATGAVFNITLIGSIVSKIGPILKQKAAPDPAMASSLPDLFVQISLFELIMIVILYLAFFNLLTVGQIIRKGENKELKYYAYGAGAWIIVFLIARYLSSIVVKVSF